MKITKAVIPAAGLGTRVLPASKAVPKEMLNIVDKPAIQYLVEECALSGITDILIITNRNKSVIEDHFDYAYELEDNLKRDAKKAGLLNSVHSVADLANIYYIRQKETKGLGHAILTAENFVGSEPFAILYGDDIILTDEGVKPVTAQLIDAFNAYGKCVCGVKECSEEQVMKYCTLDVTKMGENVYDVHKIIEKPKRENILSRFSILGRNIVTPDVFDFIRKTKPNETSGEIYFSEALSSYAETDKLCAVDFIGKRFDMGDKLGILQANCEAALRHPEIGGRFAQYIKELAKTL
ncbi:MAG: UTP--glucose-1-phosphate uridylyltransferase [Oscillospiraceae bacterium]|nr:UTP--glucose-1-phosphate uridylyltransferase [Oscillospiraceae bacterium]